MKKTSLRAQQRKRTVYRGQKLLSANHSFIFCSLSPYPSNKRITHPVGIVEVKDLAPRLVDVLVALIRPAHGQSRVHVHVVAGHVEGDQALEDDGPAGEGGGEEDEQAGRRATVSDHVEHSAEAGGLVQVAGGIAVEGVEQA